MTILQRNTTSTTGKYLFDYFNFLNVRLICISWIIFQIAIFSYNYNVLLYNDDLSNTVASLSHGFLMSRSSALLININFMLLFIFINKGVVSLICDIINIHNYYHIAIVSSIIFFSIIHTVSHIFNYYHLTLNENDIGTLLKTPSSITGVLLIGLFIMMYVFSLQFIRTNVYELFMIMHYILCIGIFICLLFHSLSCFFHTNKGVCLETTFWKCMIVPILLFVLERLHREYTGNKHTIFINAKKHSHNCTEIELYKPDFEFKPGQWVLLKCPEISRFQWHPFTITSNPIENGKVQLFIKERGEWTTQLSELLLKNNVYKNNIELKISKPYGCSYNIISQYRTVVLIAGGIGITSFISLLKSLPCKLGHGNTNVYLKKVHLHWVCKNSYDFDCFIIELNKIKGILDEYGNLLELNYYVTAGLTAGLTTGNTRVYKKIYPPSIDFIHKRPDFDILFEKLNKNNPDTNVRVIICGSKKMAKDIYKINKNYGNKFIIKNCNYFN